MFGKLNNILFRRTKAGDPVRRVADTENLNFVYSVLEGIEGVGCRIEKPTDAGGTGWRIIMDGRLSDEEPLAQIDWHLTSGDADSDDPQAQSVHFESGSGEEPLPRKAQCFQLNDIMTGDDPVAFVPEYHTLPLRWKENRELGKWEVSALSGDPKNTRGSGKQTERILPDGPETLIYARATDIVRAYFPADSQAFCPDEERFCGADTRSLTYPENSPVGLTLNMSAGGLQDDDALIVKRSGELAYVCADCPEAYIDDQSETIAKNIMDGMVREWLDTSGLVELNWGPKDDGIYIAEPGRDVDFPKVSWKWVLWCKWEDWTPETPGETSELLAELHSAAYAASAMEAAWSASETARSAAICGMAYLPQAHDEWKSAVNDLGNVTSGFESLSASASGAIITVSGLEYALSAFDEWVEEAGDRISALENRS